MLVERVRLLEANLPNTAVGTVICLIAAGTLLQGTMSRGFLWAWLGAQVLLLGLRGSERPGASRAAGQRRRRARSPVRGHRQRAAVGIAVGSAGLRRGRVTRPAGQPRRHHDPGGAGRRGDRDQLAPPAGLPALRRSDHRAGRALPALRRRRAGGGALGRRVARAVPGVLGGHLADGGRGDARGDRVPSPERRSRRRPARGASGRRGGAAPRRGRARARTPRQPLQVTLPGRGQP